MSYIELNDPEQGDEQEVEGDEEAEGPPHIRDALLLPGFVRLPPGRDRPGVDGAHRSGVQPRLQAAAAAAVHRWPHPLGRAGPALRSTFRRWTHRTGRVIGVQRRIGSVGVDSL